MLSFKMSLVPYFYVYLLFLKVIKELIQKLKYTLIQIKLRNCFLEIQQKLFSKNKNNDYNYRSSFLWLSKNKLAY